METPKTVKLNVRINPRWAEKLNAAGITPFVRTADADKALRARQAGEAAGKGLDPFRGERKDATGTVRPDSGKPVLGWDAEGRQSITLRHFLADVVGNLQMVLVNANTMQKEGDKMSSLRMTFAPKDEAVVLSLEAQGLVNELLNRTYDHLHCFRNPDGSLTVNPSHIAEQADPAEIRDLRIHTDGSLRCEKRS
ncbi:MAG: hypothetical protein Q7S16_00405 [bacterium]|nr:hypothetical protein [bacterium]